MRNFQIIVSLIALLVSLSITAGSIAPVTFDTVEQEKRYQYLIEILRCPTCQNQAISDSNALIAQDLREIVAEQVRQGKTEHEIIDFMRERYGDFISYKPTISSSTIMLWLSPVLMLILGFIWLSAKQRRKAQQQIADSELIKLEEELKSND